MKKVAFEKNNIVRIEKQYCFFILVIVRSFLLIGFYFDV